MDVPLHPLIKIALIILGILTIAWLIRYEKYVAPMFNEEEYWKQKGRRDDSANE